MLGQLYEKQNKTFSFQLDAVHNKLLTFFGCPQKNPSCNLHSYSTCELWHLFSGVFFLDMDYGTGQRYV